MFVSSPYRPEGIAPLDAYQFVDESRLSHAFRHRKPQTMNPPQRVEATLVLRQNRPNRLAVSLGRTVPRSKISEMQHLKQGLRHRLRRPGNGQHQGQADQRAGAQEAGAAGVPAGLGPG